MVECVALPHSHHIKAQSLAYITAVCLQICRNFVLLAINKCFHLAVVFCLIIAYQFQFEHFLSHPKSTKEETLCACSKYPESPKSQIFFTFFYVLLCIYVQIWWCKKSTNIIHKKNIRSTIGLYGVYEWVNRRRIFSAMLYLFIVLYSTL